MCSLLILAIIGLLSSPAFALAGHNHHGGHAAHQHKLEKKKPCEACKCSPSTKAYKKANDVMHKGMVVQYTGDVDTDFVRGMIPHHRGAVDMVDVVLEYGYRPDVRELAEWIKTVQIQEIGQMEHWLLTRGVVAPRKDADMKNSTKAYEAAMHGMHKAMDIKFSGDADTDFLRGMIQHHQGAIDMAEVVLREGRDPFVIALARDVVRTQSAEIGRMNRMLERKQ